MASIYFYTNTAGTEVAKWPGTSEATESGSRKKNQFYLGRVIDREKLIFYKRGEGYFHFDPVTLEKAAINPEDVPDYTSPLDHRIHVQTSICVFGGSYFLSRLIPGIEYDSVLKTITASRLDTLNTMVQYYLLSSASDNQAEFWYYNSFAHFIFPKAQLASQRISEFYSAIGKPDVRRAFLAEHIKYIKHTTDEEYYVMIDSTGCPNAIGIPITVTSRHENEVNIEFRVIVIIQKSTGLPIYYEVIPGNIVDISTIHNVLRKLNLLGCKVHYIIGDAGYNCPAVMERLVFEGIDFMTRMNPAYTLYSEILKNNYDELISQSASHIVEYKGRMVKVLKIPTVIGEEKETGEKKNGIVYLCRDLQAHHSKADHVLNSKEFQKKTIEERLAFMEKLGIFAIVTTLDLQEEQVLPMYYTRQMIEQFFDYIKSYGKLMPIRKCTMETVYGHVLVSFIAAFLAVVIKNRLNIIDLPYVAVPSVQATQICSDDTITIVDNDDSDEDGKTREIVLSQDSLLLGFKPSPDRLFRTLQLYCADIWDEEIVPAVAPKEVKDFYEAFGIRIPETILRKKEGIFQILRKDEKEKCTRKRVFAHKPIHTDAEIIAKREAEKAKRLQELAAQQGMQVIQSDQSQEQPTVQKEKRGPGRPKGSKNKKTLEREKEQQNQQETERRRPGRPKGSKNRNTNSTDKNEGKKRGRPPGSKDSVKRKRRSDAKTSPKPDVSEDKNPSKNM